MAKVSKAINKRVKSFKNQKTRLKRKLRRN